MPPTALTYQYTNQSYINALLSEDGLNLRLDDGGDGSVSVAELGYLTNQGINYATARVDFHCAPRYEPSDMVQSQLVWEWGTILAGRWLCLRRCNPVPDSIQGLWEEVLEDLKAVHAGQMQIPHIGTRDEQWPAWSNMELDQRYLLKKLRVQRPVSESGRPYRQVPSRWADRVVEY